MERTLFEFSIKAVLSLLFQNSMNGIDMILVQIFGINKDVVQGDNDKDI